MVWKLLQRFRLERAGDAGSQGEGERVQDDCTMRMWFERREAASLGELQSLSVGRGVEAAGARHGSAIGTSSWLHPNMFVAQHEKPSVLTQKNRKTVDVQH